MQTWYQLISSLSKFMFSINWSVKNLHITVIKNTRVLRSHFINNAFFSNSHRYDWKSLNHNNMQKYWHTGSLLKKTRTALLRCMVESEVTSLITHASKAWTWWTCGNFIQSRPKILSLSRRADTIATLDVLPQIILSLSHSLICLARLRCAVCSVCVCCFRGSNESFREFIVPRWEAAAPPVSTPSSPKPQPECTISILMELLAARVRRCSRYPSEERRRTQNLTGITCTFSQCLLCHYTARGKNLSDSQLTLSFRRLFAQIALLGWFSRIFQFSLSQEAYSE